MEEKKKDREKKTKNDRVDYYNCIKCTSLASTNELSSRPVGI